MVEAREILQRARGRNPAIVLMTGISALILATFQLGIELGDAAVGIFRDPLGTIGPGSAAILGALLNGAAAIMWTGARTTQQAFLPGSPWAIGPLAFAFSVLAAGLGLVAMAKILQIPATSDTFPGTFSDFDPPLLDIGADEEDDN